MLENTVIAVHSDQDGYHNIGYGNTVKDAFEDLEAIMEGEMLDYSMLVFYERLPVKAKITFE